MTRRLVHTVARANPYEPSDTGTTSEPSFMASHSLATCRGGWSNLEMDLFLHLWPKVTARHREREPQFEYIARWIKAVWDCIRLIGIRPRDALVSASFRSWRLLIFLMMDLT